MRMANRGVSTRKGFQQAIKELRRDLEDGGLAWVHATESAGKYLQTILPGVCDVAAEVRGTYRHTSSQDKYDLKKVVTSRFYKFSGPKIASCHAHGDGTWSILFTEAGKAQLAKADIPSSIRDVLKVTVFQRVDDNGNLFHYGEMINKPDVCRRPVSENNDEKHRLKQMELDEVEKRPLTEVFISRMVHGEARVDDNGDALKGPVERLAQRKSRYSPHGGGETLSPDERQLGIDLAKEDLTGKEQRSLFRKLKSLPLEQQEMILQLSRKPKGTA